MKLFYGRNLLMFVVS